MIRYGIVVCFFFQAEDGIRDLVRSRGLGDVYKRQPMASPSGFRCVTMVISLGKDNNCFNCLISSVIRVCLLYTSDAADERSSVDLGGRRIIKKKKSLYHNVISSNNTKH